MIFLFSSTLTLLIFIHHDFVLFKHIDSFDLYPIHSPSKTNVSDDDDLSESTQIVRQFNVYQVSHLHTLTKRNNSSLLDSGSGGKNVIFSNSPNSIFEYSNLL